MFDPSLIRFEELVPPGANWSHVLKRGTTLRLTDCEGGVNVSALFFNFELLSERFNLADTLKAQHTAKLTSGCCLYSDMGRILVSITDDSRGWHDPLSGPSDAQVIREKYGDRDYQAARNARYRNGRDNFLVELGKYGLGECDLLDSINFFSKVSVQEGGKLSWEENRGILGEHIDLRAEMNTLVILNTCPHPLDPSPVFNAKPVHLTVWTSALPGADDLCRNSCPENQRGFLMTERYFQ